MKLGDLVEYNGARWKVTAHRREFRICELTNLLQNKVEVPDDLENTEEAGLGYLIVICNPTEDWPWAQVKLKSESVGPVRQVLRQGRELTPLVDWVPGDFQRPGGAIFFNPSLRLRVGEVLVAVHRDGTRSRVGLSQAFGTVARRKARAETPRRPSGPKTRFDRILGADPFGDDDE